MDQHYFGDIICWDGVGIHTVLAIVGKYCGYDKRVIPENILKKITRERKNQGM